MSKPTNYHSLRRTSPKGESFIGQCVLCGKENLPITAINNKCLNPKRTTEEEAIIGAIEGVYYES